jgi:DNA-binding Lrp family transcriptional regulator|tara:strand:- start:358 stop:783 length:426 start_codon:yes stop_codon:yes gene_type:complete
LLDKLDKIDKQIIDILKEDSSTSVTSIKKKIKLSETAIRNRILTLKQNGVIKKFTIEINQEQKSKAITLISVNPSSLAPKIAELLKSINGVEIIYEITGQYDIIAILSADNINEVNSCIDEIRTIDGVADSNTIIILRELH